MSNWENQRAANPKNLKVCTLQAWDPDLNTWNIEDIAPCRNIPRITRRRRGTLKAWHPKGKDARHPEGMTR